jgi:hypothetical protein
MFRARGGLAHSNAARARVPGLAHSDAANIPTLCFPGRLGQQSPDLRSRYQRVSTRVQPQDGVWLSRRARSEANIRSLCCGVVAPRDAWPRRSSSS